MHCLAAGKDGAILYPYVLRGLVEYWIIIGQFGFQVSVNSR